MRHIILKRKGILTTLLIFCFLTSISQVTGVVNYHENPSNPLPSVTVELYDDNDVFIASTVTNSIGEFEFYNIPDGDYYISASADLETGDVDLIDASLVLQYLFGLITFTDYEFTAADVNGSGNVTFGDYILILVFHIMQGNPFPTEEWHFNELAFTVASSRDITEPLMVWGTSAGDVEGIWQPGGRDLDIVAFENTAITEVSENEVELVIGTDYNGIINGFNLNMNYPYNLIEITDVQGPDENFHYDIDAQTGTLKVIWLDESENQSTQHSGEKLFTVTAKKLVSNYSDEAIFGMLDGGMVLNSRSDKIGDITIKLPTIKTTTNIEELEVTSYPNPVVNSLNINIISPEEGMAKITIYDVQGRFINEMIVTVNPGTQQVNIDTEALNKGQYLYTINMRGKNLHGRFLK